MKYGTKKTGTKPSDTSFPPVLTHQPGVPAVSASRKNPGGSPKPTPSSPPPPMSQCHDNDGPVPYPGDLVWMWQQWKGGWQPYHVIRRESHALGGPRWILLDTETGEYRAQRTNKLYKIEE